MKRFEQQVAVITGGARGIGASIGRRLAEEGAKAYLLDLKEDSVAVAAKGMQRNGLLVEAIVMDISREEQVKRAFDSVIEAEGRLDILVNSAGIIGLTNTKITDYDLVLFKKYLR